MVMHGQRAYIIRIVVHKCIVRKEIVRVVRLGLWSIGGRNGSHYE